MTDISVTSLKDAIKELERARENKSRAIYNSIKVRTTANALLTASIKDPSFENQTAYARAYYYVKEADAQIKQLHEEYLVKYKQFLRFLYPSKTKMFDILNRYLPYISLELNEHNLTSIVNELEIILNSHKETINALIVDKNFITIINIVDENLIKIITKFKKIDNFDTIKDMSTAIVSALYMCEN